MHRSIQILSINLLLLIWQGAEMTQVHAQTSKQFEDAWKKTSGYFTAALSDKHVVGGALLFLDKGKVAGSEYYGLADIEENRRVDEHTIFHWASITKTFTGIAIMQLRDRGLLSLDDPVTKYLPELRKVHNPYGSMDDITIRMIMSHSAGFRSPTWPWRNQPWQPFEPTEWSQIVAMLPYTEVKFKPGSDYNYSNPAIIFLGRIIEMLTGDAYEVYTDKNIFKPLGMYHSYYDITPYHLRKFRSNNYTLRNGRPEANGLDFDTGITASNGGLNAPLKDMVNYLAFLTGAYEGEEILKRSSLKEMWQAQQLIEETAETRSSMGLSFFIEEFKGKRLIGHTGTQKSFYSFFYIHPPSGTACIGITNTDSNQGALDAGQLRREVSYEVIRTLFSFYK